MKIYTREFWLDASERVIGSAAAAALPSAMLIGTDRIDYAVAATITLGAAVATALKCVIAGTVGEKGTASLLPVEAVPPA